MSTYEPDFNERCAYKQLVNHGRCPIYDDKNAIAYIGKIASYFRSRLFLYNSSFTLPPEAIIMLITALLTSKGNPGASISEPTTATQETGGLGIESVPEREKAVLGVMSILYLCNMLMNTSGSLRSDTVVQDIRLNPIVTGFEDKTVSKNTMRALTRASAGGSHAVTINNIRIGKELFNVKESSFSLLARFTEQALVRNYAEAATFFNKNLNASIDMGRDALSSYNGLLEVARFLIVVVTVISFFITVDSSNLTYTMESKPLRTSQFYGDATNACLANEARVDVRGDKGSTYTRCMAPMYATGPPRGASADRYAFAAIAILTLVISPWVQIIWRVFSIIIGLPKMHERDVITIDTQLNPTKRVSINQPPQRILLELFSLAYDPSTTPLREQSYNDLYIGKDITEKEIKNSIYTRMHSDVASRKTDEESRKTGATTFVTLISNRVSDIQDLAFYDNIFVGANRAQNPRWKMIPPNYNLTDYFGYCIHSVKLYIKGTEQYTTLDDFENAALRDDDSSAFRVDQELKYRLTTEANRYNKIVITLKKIKYVHRENVSPDTFFPWAAVATATESGLTTYRARITNIMAVLCLRIWICISCFIASAFDKLPWPMGNWVNRTSETRYDPSTRVENTNDYKQIDVTTGAWGSNGYTGKLTSSPRPMLIMLGFYFAFQVLWILLSVFFHRLVRMELGYYRALSKEGPVEIQEDVNKGEPMKYWSRFQKYAKAARKRRITDNTTSYMTMAIALVVTAASSVEEDWLMVAIASSGIGTVLLYMFLNYTVFKDVLTLKKRRAIYTERGMNEQIEEEAREGEEDLATESFDPDAMASTGLLPNKLIF